MVDEQSFTEKSFEENLKEVREGSSGYLEEKNIPSGGK